jgi:hypothetical protein
LTVICTPVSIPLKQLAALDAPNGGAPCRQSTHSAQAIAQPAGEALKDFWLRQLAKVLTSELGQEIVDQVRKFRVERHSDVNGFGSVTSSL